MPNRQYQSGNRYEVKVADVLRGVGFLVIQTRGSKGYADLVAVRRGRLVLVQVKSGYEAERAMTHEEWNGLYYMGEEYGAEAVLACCVPRRPTRYLRLTGSHRKGAWHWPSVPWNPDAPKIYLER